MSSLFVALFVLLAANALAESLPAGALWCPGECRCHSSYRDINCSSAQLNFVPSLPEATQSLFLSFNLLPRLPANAFGNLTDCVSLDLGDNELRVLDSASFIGLANLHRLSVVRNRIKHVSVTSGVLPLLDEFDISDNRLWEIPRNLSHFLPNLRRLQLSGNHIASAWFEPSYALLTSLSSVELSRNPLFTLSDFHMAAIEHSALSSLVLSDCGISSLGERSLSFLTNLTLLDLSLNPIPTNSLLVELAHFPNNSKVLRLNVSSLALSRLDALALSRFSSLHVLDASNNSLSRLDDGFFVHMRVLRQLYLQRNALSSLPDTSPLEQLRTLNLRYNVLAHVELRHLRQLRDLDLRYNQLQQLSNSWLDRHAKLRNLRLSHNVIANIAEHAFNGVALDLLDISNNQISRLRDFGLVRLVRLIANRNRIGHVGSDAFLRLQSSVEEIDLSENELCELPRDAGYSFLALQRLNLSSNRLGDIMSFGGHVPLFSTLRFVQVLDLSHNNLSRVEPLPVPTSLSRLTTLALSHNRMTSVASLRLEKLPELATLDLSYNLLNGDGLEPIFGLTFLSRLELVGNPLLCSCRLRPLRAWLNRSGDSLLAQSEEWRCAAPPDLVGQRIGRVDIATCPAISLQSSQLRRELIVFGATAGSVLLLTLFIAACVHTCRPHNRFKALHYRWQVRYREVGKVPCEP